MDDDHVPTLQRLSIKGVLIHLWSREGTKRCIESKLDTIFNENIKEWERVEEKIKQDIFDLFPKKLANEFADDLRPIGLELLAWIEFHFVHVKLKPKIPDKISWSSKGTIDPVKTAEILIKDESIDLYDRYKLACAFCFESHISELWEKVDQNNVKEDEYGLVLFWTHQKGVRKTDTAKIIQGSPYDWAFKRSAESANIVGAKYFFEKLNAEERKKNFYLIGMLLPFLRNCDGYKWTKGYFLKRYCFDFFLFALRDLSEEQRNICRNYIARIHPYRTGFPDCLSLERYLTGFLEWPFQEILLDTAISIWNLLPPGDKETYSGFLYALLQKIIKGHDDHDYIRLFKTFWQHLPAYEKKYIINHSTRYWMKFDICKFAQRNNISLIFEDWYPSDRDYAMLVEQDRVHSDNSDVGLLKFYILVCMCPHEIMLRYKDDYKERISKAYNLKFPREDVEEDEEYIGRWYDFFECLEEFLEHEEEEKSLSKNYKCPAGKKFITEPITRFYCDRFCIGTIPRYKKRSLFGKISDTVSDAVSRIRVFFYEMKYRRSEIYLSDVLID